MSGSVSMSGRAFDHLLVVMFENQYRGYVKENPYFAWLARDGVELESSFGVMHPSQTNYIASIAGEICNVTSDDRPTPLPQRTIVDLVEAAGLGWKAYMDGYCPHANPWTADLAPVDEYPYVVKHNPFSSFAGVLGSAERWARVVSEAQLWVDLRAGELPEYAWLTPNMWNDGHYIRGTREEPKARAPELVDQAAQWLEWLFATLRFPGRDSLLPPRTLVAVTFDESDFEAAYEVRAKNTRDGPNQIYTVLLGDVVAPGTVETEGYSHYSLLRTAEENFGLGTLGKNDADSNWMRFLWGKRFAWGEPAQTPLRDCRAVAAASLGDALHVVQEAGGGKLVHRAFDGSGWSAEEPVPADGFAPALGAASDGSLLLALVLPGGGVAALSFRPDSGWDQQPLVHVDGADAVALAACNRGADLMCVWRAPSGELWSRRRRGESWEDPVATGRTAAGGFALHALGHVLLLVVAAADGELACATYGTADFNVTTLPERRHAGPYDDAVKDAWSPDAFPVAHFGAAASPLTPGEREPDLRPYRSAGPFALAALDGVVSLVHPRHAETHLAITTFSIAGVLTSKLPVSYKASDETTTSNGYGTLAEAGWSVPRPIAGTRWDGGKALAMARRGAELVLLHQPGPGCAVLMSSGRYQRAPGA